MDYGYRYFKFPQAYDTEQEQGHVIKGFCDLHIMAKYFIINFSDLLEFSQLTKTVFHAFFSWLSFLIKIAIVVLLFLWRTAYYTA